MIDFHSHLQDPEFDADREAVIARAFMSGVSKIVLVGTDAESSRKAIALAERYEQMVAVVGFHPYEFNQRPTTNDQRQNTKKDAGTQDFASPEHVASVLEPMVSHPKVVGIGECGLDFHSFTDAPISDAEKENQRKGFSAQASLAKKYNLPLIIHTRPSTLTSDDAYRELYAQLEACSAQHASESGSSESESSESGSGTAPVPDPFLSTVPRTPSPVPPLVLHGYQGSVSVTKKFLEMPNVYFSFAGNVTYPVKKSLVGGEYDIREIVKLIPLNRILTETDSPYLPPQSLRGRRNEPANVRYIVEEIARMKNIQWGKVEIITEKIFGNIF